MRSLGNCKIGFRSANSFTKKKVLLIIVALSLFIYIMATSGLAGLLVLLIPISLSGLLMMLRKMSMKVFSFGDMFKQDILDILPVSVSITPESFDIKIDKAEIIDGKVVDEIYHFKPVKENELIYYKNSGLFKFNIPSVNVSIVYSDGKTVEKTLTKTLFGFYVNKKTGLEIVRELKENDFNIFIAENELKKKQKKQKEKQNNIKEVVSDKEN